MQSRDESEDDADDEEEESPNISVGLAFECDDRSSEDENHLQSQTPISSPTDLSIAANDGQPQTSSKQMG